MILFYRYEWYDRYFIGMNGMIDTFARSPLYVPIFILTQVFLERSTALLSTESTSVISLIGTSITFWAYMLRRPLHA